MNEIRIKVKAYESSLVETAIVKIVEFSKQLKGKISGPIPLPTKRELFTILRSVHIHKKSREQFERKTHKRLIVIKDASEQLIDGLKRMELASGVQVEIKIK